MWVNPLKRGLTALPLYIKSKMLEGVSEFFDQWKRGFAVASANKINSSSIHGSGCNATHYARCPIYQASDACYLHKANELCKE